MLKTNTKKNLRGFTLAEMLVTVGVFAITMTVSSSIFINVNNLQQQTANMAKLQNEGRYILEKISKEIRGRELDYAQINLDSVTGLTDTLVFKPDEFGETYTVYYNTNNKSINVQTYTEVAGIKTAILSSEEITVDKMQFRISPTTDPYDISVSSSPLEQSRVTIMMEIKNANTMERYQKKLLLQTTISSKNYR